MNKKQSGILSFLKKPKDTESIKLTAFRPDLPSPKPVTTKLKELSSPNSTPSKRRHIAYDKVRERKFLASWLSEFEWLVHDRENNLKYCSYCREFKHLLKNPQSRFIIGTDNFRLAPIREHGHSKDHSTTVSARAAKQEPKKTPLQILKQKIDNKHIERLQSLFNSAFVVATQNWSFKDFEILVQLQIKNGVPLGHNYQNTHAAKSFIESITSVQRQELVATLANCRFFSIMADGSTDRSIAEQESVYVRFVANGEAVNRFIALQEVETADASGILASIDNALMLYAQISTLIQKEKLVNINLDGAAVNMGIYNGVATRVQERNGQHITVTHCINHGLELAVLDSRKEDEYLVEFDINIKRVFSFYHTSPKRVRELHEVAKSF